MCHTGIKLFCFILSILYCQYSSHVNDHKGDYGFKIGIVIWPFVCDACISITFVSADKSRHSPLFMRAISCMFMYQNKPICIRVLLPFKSYIHLPAYSMPSGLQPCPGSWATLPSQGFPRNLLLFIMHSTPLDDCRRRTLHHCSLQREAETDWRMGSEFKKPPVRMGYPIGWLA